MWFQLISVQRQEFGILPSDSRHFNRSCKCDDEESDMQTGLASEISHLSYIDALSSNGMAPRILRSTQESALSQVGSGFHFLDDIMVKREREGPGETNTLSVLGAPAIRFRLALICVYR
jgi:hypothetical protein